MRHQRAGLLFGSAVLAVGVILLLNQQGIVDAAQIFPFFWPVALLAAGLLSLTRSTASGGRVWGGILTTAGILLFLDRLGYARFSFHALWPLILIGVGVTLVWRTLEGHPPVSSDPVPDANLVNQFAAFGGGELKSDAKDFRGGEVLTVFGGYQVDLRKAAIARSPAILHANAMFGGIEIRVPRNWRVVLDGLPLLGGYSDETEHPEPQYTGTPIPELIVKGFASFGGVVVKN